MSFKKSVCVFIVLFSFSWFSAADDFADAMYDFQAENYSSAHLKFTRLASLGHQDSQFNIGAMYFRGQGVEKNKIEAYAWIALAAESGDETRAQLRDNLMARFNEQEKATALERTTALLALYSEESLQKKLIPEYLSNEKSAYSLREIEKSQPEYPRTASRLGLSGSVDVEYAIDRHGHAKNYRVLESTNEIFDDAVINAVKKWRFEPLLHNGVPIARAGVRNRVYFRMENDEIGDFSERKLDEAFRNLRYKSNSGLALDVFAYAYTAEMLPEQRLSWEEINQLYFTAAQAGLVEAQYQLGLNLLYGKGCVADRAKAIAWLNYSARANYAPAQLVLANELMSGEHVAADTEEAWQWLERAVKAEYPEAMITKAWLLATSDDDSLRDGDTALALVNAVVKTYPDKFTAQQTLAASQAEVGDFDAALKSQRRVVKWAKDLALPAEIEQQRLDAYTQKVAWREPGVIISLPEDEELATEPLAE